MINLTEAAIAELKKFRESSLDISDTDVVRIQITSGGCAGFQYNMNFQNNEDVDLAKDNILEFDGIRVAVDKKSMLYLDGTTVDWVEDLNHRGFNFDNPNSVKNCACKSSFSV
jgi:iron-sulfur cluster assembly protein